MGQANCKEGAAPKDRFKAEAGRLSSQVDYLSSLTVPRLHSMTPAEAIRFNGYVRNIRFLRDEMEFNIPLFSLPFVGDRSWITRKVRHLNLLLERIEGLQRTKADEDCLKAALKEVEVKEDEAAQKKKKKEDDEEEEKKRLKRIVDDMELKLRMEKSEADALFYKIISAVMVLVVVLAKLVM